MRKMISVLLSFVLLFPVISVAGAGALAADAYVAYPTIYINGGRGALYSADGTKIAPVDTPEGFLADAVKDCVPDLAKALLSGSQADTDAYKEKLVSWIAPLYDDLRLTDSGEAPAPVTVGYGSSGYFTIPAALPNRISGGEYPLRAYDYYYDWRLDPMETAEELNRYIDVVLASTGRDKVNLVGRCEGGCPVLAYLAKYGHGRVNKIVFFNTASNGYLLPTQMFSGKLDFKMARVKAWLDNNVHFSMDELDLSAELSDLLGGILSMSTALPELDLAGAALDAAYNRVLRSVIPDVILASYGTMPAVWAMIAASDLPDAVEYVFAGREAQYAGLIEKIEYYYENVQTRSEELLKACAADGIEIAVLAKYGYPAIPLTAEADLLSDGEALVKYLSFGAVTSTYRGTLSETYINNRPAEYISADKKIDASTCLFPETTWFFGAVDHQATPDELNNLSQAFFTCRTPMDVHTYAQYPRFMVRDGENGPMVPLTEENAATSVVGLGAEEPGPVSSFDRFMSGILGLVLRLVLRVRAVIDGIVAHANGTA